MRQQCDVGVAEVSAAGENAAQQDRGVDGGNFRVPDSFSSVDIAPVVKETAMMRQLRGKEPQGGKYAQARFRAGDETSAIADAKRRKSEAGCGDAGYG